MKIFIIILSLLFVSPSFAGPNDPPANAFTFEVEAGQSKGKWNVALFATQPLNGQIGLRLVTQKSGSAGGWIYVNSEIFFEDAIKSESDLSDTLLSILEKHSARIKEYFLLDDSEVIPESLFEAVQKFISSGIEFKNGQLVKRG